MVRKVPAPLRPGFEVVPHPADIGIAFWAPDLRGAFQAAAKGLCALLGGVVSPGGVGFDINCGVRLLVGDIREQDVRPRLADLVVALAREVPAGTGKGGKLSLAREELDAVLHGGLSWALNRGYARPEDLAHCEEGGRIAGADPALASDRARNRGHDQLGTLGSGNHFMELQVVEEVFEPRIAEAFGHEVGLVVLMIHSGSRGLGHQVATDYIRNARSACPGMTRTWRRLPGRKRSDTRHGTRPRLLRVASSVG